MPAEQDGQGNAELAGHFPLAVLQHDFPNPQLFYRAKAALVILLTVLGQAL